MSKFTVEALVPGEFVDVEDCTSGLDDDLGTGLRADILRLRSSTHEVLPRDSRKAARDKKFEHSVGSSSVVKYRALDRKERDLGVPRLILIERTEVSECRAQFGLTDNRKPQLDCQYVLLLVLVGRSCVYIVVSTYARALSCR